MDVESVGATDAVPVDISASFVLRWSLGPSDDNCSTGMVQNLFLENTIDARVTILTLRSSTNPQGAVHPQAIEMSIRDGDEESIPPWVEAILDPATSAPQTLVRVDAALPDLRPFWLVGPGGEPMMEPKVHGAFYTFLMGCAALALEKITEADDVPVRTVSPADLLGDGVVRFENPAADEHWFIRLPSRPPLGQFEPSSHQGEPVARELDVQVTFATAVGASQSVSRLSRWGRLMNLRYSRGEWAEAVVAIEAQFEALTWEMLETLLVDHGWRRADFEHSEASYKGWQVRRTLNALRHHLGGSNADWDAARSHFEACWELRNDVVHRAAPATRAMADRAHESAQPFIDLLLGRLRDERVARKHPITAASFLDAEQIHALFGDGFPERLALTIPTLGMEKRDVNDILDSEVRPADLTREVCGPTIAVPYELGGAAG